VLSWAMISLWVGRWRSQVPSVDSPEYVEGGFCKLRLNGVLRSSSMLLTGAPATSKGPGPTNNLNA
jgi:hypothetical protein